MSSGKPMAKSALWTALTVVLCGAAALLLWAAWPSDDTRIADPTNAERVALGQALYREHCASCHGANLQGQPNWRQRKADGRLPAPPHDATGHTWHHPDDDLFRMTMHGFKPPLTPEGYESDMPGFDGVLTPEQAWAVLAYIKSTWPPAILARQEDLNRRSKQ